MTRAAAIACFALAAALVACTGEDPGAACVAEPAPDVDLIVAGTGSALRLVDGLVEAWRSGDDRPSVWIPESIGSGGALEALADGAIDVALLSRPLRPQERADGMVDLPIARTAVIFAVHDDVAATDLSAAELQALWRGDVSAWPDGTPVVLLLREPGDSGLGVIRAQQPELADAIEDARATGRGTVLLTDQEMVLALAANPGAIGIVDLGLVFGVGLPVRPVGIDGVQPTPERVADDTWPLVKTLRLVLPADASAGARAFAALATDVDAGSVASAVRREQGLAAP